MKHNLKLTKDERAIESAIRRGEYTSVSNLKEEKKRYAKIARYTLEKTKTINVRVTEKNLVKLKAAAAREGIPYQTFLTSLIHKKV